MHQFSSATQFFVYFLLFENSKNKTTNTFLLLFVRYCFESLVNISQCESLVLRRLFGLLFLVKSKQSYGRSIFSHWVHLHEAPHFFPLRWHSQQFFWHLLFWQLHPFPSDELLAENNFSLLQQETHSQALVHVNPCLKHSQQFFWHLVFEHVHFLTYV